MPFYCKIAFNKFQNHFQSNFFFIMHCPVSWACRIHRLHLWRVGDKTPSISVLDITLNNLCWGSSDAGVLGIRSTPSLPSLPGPLWPGVVMVLSMSQIKLISVLIITWIVWSRSFWHLNCILMLNWIVWNRTNYMYKNGLGIE